MKLILADDHKIFRDGVLEFIRQENSCREAWGAASVDEARKLVAEKAPDILVSDLSFPKESGISLFQWCRREHPQVACLCLTMHGELSQLAEVLQTGVRGYVTKSSGYDELIDGILRVLRGEIFLDQFILNQALHSLQREFGQKSLPVAPHLERIRQSDDLAALTPRERELFSLILQEKTLKEISGILHLSVKTVENHRSNIYRKLGIHDRLNLFRFAQERNLIS